MNILNFDMPSFSRIQWSSLEVKEKYEPILEEARGLSAYLDKIGVIKDVKKVFTDNVYCDKERYINDLEGMGMSFKVIEENLKTVNGIAMSETKANPNEANHDYICAGNVEDNVDHFVEAHRTQNHQVMGELLGFPSSSIKFFIENFVDKNIIDPIWQQASNTKNINSNKNMIILKDIPWELNPILKTQGIYTTFCYPEAFDCEETLIFIRTIIEQCDKDLASLKELLEMPFEWSCLKGIAVVKTPIFKMFYNSNTASEEFIVRYLGKTFPIEAPFSKEFPWNQKVSLLAKGDKHEK